MVCYETYYLVRVEVSNKKLPGLSGNTRWYGFMSTLSGHVEAFEAWNRPVEITNLHITRFRQGYFAKQTQFYRT